MIQKSVLGNPLSFGSQSICFITYTKIILIKVLNVKKLWKNTYKYLHNLERKGLSNLNTRTKAIRENAVGVNQI